MKIFQSIMVAFLVWIHAASAQTAFTIQTKNAAVSPIENTATNAKPNVFVFITQNFGASGPNCGFPVGIKYENNKWNVASLLGTTTLPNLTNFNVLVIPENATCAFKHTAAAKAKSTQLDNTSINGKSNASLIVTYDVTNGIKNASNLAVKYQNNRWSIINEDGSDIPKNARFNVLIVSNGFAHTLNLANVHPSWGSTSIINNAATNDKKDALLFVTHQYKAKQMDGPLSVWWDNGKWTVFGTTNVTMKEKVGEVVNCYVYGGGGPCGNGTPTVTTRQMTSFLPEVHGFKFINSFSVQSQFGGLNGPTFGGLCGGMVYAALDYYLAKITIPQQNYMPAEGMPLQSYLWDRQQTSFWPNTDRWIEYHINPFGSRNRDFFNWGIELGTGQFGQLKTSIDKGEPMPIGLVACGDDCACPGPDKCPGDHQVLAIGYDMGKYKGDKGDNINDLSIFVYDPNYPNKTLTLRPDAGGAMYLYRQENSEGVTRCRWRAYFANTKYARSSPPLIPNNPSEIQVTFCVGGDDLRGGNDNVNLVVFLKNGNTLRFDNVNNGKRWVDFSDQTISRPLDSSIKNEDIIGVNLETTFGGGIGGDNWNLDCIIVKTKIGGNQQNVLQEGDVNTNSLLFRFTGNQKVKEFRRDGFEPNQVIATFGTGGDDLRGGNDNVHLVILLRNGSNIRFNNVNDSNNWGNQTSQTIKRNLPAAIRNDDIMGVRLETTFGGGFGGDNWNLDKLIVKTKVNGVEQGVLEYGHVGNLLFRFTGDQKNKEFKR